jgi:hypothetical protein
MKYWQVLSSGVTFSLTPLKMKQDKKGVLIYDA